MGFQSISLSPEYEGIQIQKDMDNAAACQVKMLFICKSVRDLESTTGTVFTF